MKRMVTVAMFAVLFAGVVLAQGPPMPKPQPEHQKLLVDEWKSEGEMQASPFGPAGKFTSTDHNQMLGDFFLVIHSEGSGPEQAPGEGVLVGERGILQIAWPTLVQDGSPCRSICCWRRRHAPR